jgi:hypothetical protein
MKRIVALLEMYCYQQAPRGGMEIEEYLTMVYTGSEKRQATFEAMHPGIISPTPVPTPLPVTPPPPGEGTTDAA